MSPTPPSPEVVAAARRAIEQLKVLFETAEEPADEAAAVELMTQAIAGAFAGFTPPQETPP